MNPFEWVFVIYLFINGHMEDQIVFEMTTVVQCEEMRDYLMDSEMPVKGVRAVFGPCHQKREA